MFYFCANTNVNLGSVKKIVTIFSSLGLCCITVKHDTVLLRVGGRQQARVSWKCLPHALGPLSPFAETTSGQLQVRRYVGGEGAVVCPEPLVASATTSPASLFWGRCFLSQVLSRCISKRIRGVFIYSSLWSNVQVREQVTLIVE